MTDSVRRKPRLRLVVTSSPFDDMETLRAKNAAAFAARAVHSKEPPRPQRLSRPRSWVPLYFDELATLRLPPLARLLYVLRYRSFRGKKALVLDVNLATEADIEPRKRSRYARRLEKLGLLKVEREGQRTLRVWVL